MFICTLWLLEIKAAVDVGYRYWALLLYCARSRGGQWVWWSIFGTTPAASFSACSDSDCAQRGEAVHRRVRCQWEREERVMDTLLTYSDNKESCARWRSTCEYRLSSQGNTLRLLRFVENGAHWSDFLPLHLTRLDMSNSKDSIQLTPMNTDWWRTLIQQSVLVRVSRHLSGQCAITFRALVLW